MISEYEKEVLVGRMGGVQFRHSLLRSTEALLDHYLDKDRERRSVRPTILTAYRFKGFVWVKHYDGMTPTCIGTADDIKQRFVAMFAACGIGEELEQQAWWLYDQRFPEAVDNE